MVYGKMCVQQYWTPIYYFMADVEPCYHVITELWQRFFCYHFLVNLEYLADVAQLRRLVDVIANIMADVIAIC